VASVDAGTGNYSSGHWKVRPGKEGAFVAQWTQFLEWTRDRAPGFVSAQLIRDSHDPTQFVSFAQWETLGALTAWRELAGFAARIESCRSLCEEFQGSNYTVASRVTQ
jgi:heme-degrading monooxygenase HmoA